MEVLSSKPQVTSHADVSSDKLPNNPNTTPENGFQQLMQTVNTPQIAQDEADLTKVDIKNVDIKKSDTKKIDDIVTDTIPPMSPMSATDNQLLAQLSMATVQTQTAEKKDMNSDSPATPATSETPQASETKALIGQQQAQNKQIENKALQNVQLDPKLMPVDLSLNLPTPTDKMPKQKVTTVKEADSVATKLLKDNFTSVDPVKTISIEPFNSVIPSKDALDSNTTQNNKYVDALKQLGHSIGEQVSQHFDKLDQTVPATIATGGSYAEIAKQVKSTDPEITVELIPQTVSSMVKEAYDAKIKIYPPDLGHVLAKLKIDHNSAQLVMVADNNKVKEIIEANLPQLREHFRQADIQLTSIHVETASSGSKDQNAETQSHNEQAFARNSTNEQESEQIISKETKKTLNTIIDTYA